MEKIKHKRKSTKKPQLLENSRADRKRAKKDVVSRMVMTYLESKTRGGVYRHVKTFVGEH